MPWEVIIKDFRREIADATCDHIYIWANRFRDYVANHSIFKSNSERQKRFVEQILSEQFYAVMTDWSKEIEGLLFERQTKSVKDKYPELMMMVIERRNTSLQKVEFYAGFDDAEGERILEHYRAEFDDIKLKVFGSLPLEQQHHDMLTQLAKNVLTRARPDWFTTGLVFSGFGSNELFPFLSCIEMGGFVNDKVRWVQKRKVDIDRADRTAEIIPFAQRDAVDALLFGRLSRYESLVVSHFADAMRQVGSGLVQQLTKAGSKRKDFEDRLEAAVASVVTHFRTQHSPQLNSAFADDTLDIVRHMPKPDLAAFAESLVTVSSMKRKVTVGPETVGGPVDVAVISRHEGFIWVKRKLYFAPDLNQRYMSRVFGSK